MDHDAGIDIFYNPSPKLTFQFTANPDFAQIEADPHEFNISRYESYFSERRPFFTEGNEIFMASGRQRNTGFYRPLELFYSRRIGKKLPDGSEVPLLAGTKAFGRINQWEYGGFMALTGETDYVNDEGENQTEEQAYLGYAKEDDFIDRGIILGYNMQFRNQWGFEINYDGGDSRDLDVRYTSHNVNLNSWFSISPKW